MQPIRESTVRILTEADVAVAIHKCKPKKVAVAYLGADWKQFIPDTKNLEYVVVSPELGTNPKAVRKLAAKIGWERVHLLDRLHAKAFLGDHGAVVGSANLTKNGLSGKGRIELCVTIKSDAKLAQLEGLLDAWQTDAARQYPTAQAKIEKMVELEATLTNAIVNGLASRSDRTASISDFNLVGDDDFYVCWYQDGESQVYEPHLQDMDETFDDDMHFAKDETVKPNKWVLVWKATEAMTPDSGEPPYWLFMHQVFRKGIVDNGYGYPQCGIQRNDLRMPQVPFRLTNELVAAFRQAMLMPEFREYFVQEGMTYRLGKSQKGLPALVEYLRNTA